MDLVKCSLLKCGLWAQIGKAPYTYQNIPRNKYNRGNKNLW